MKLLLPRDIFADILSGTEQVRDTRMVGSPLTLTWNRKIFVW